MSKDVGPFSFGPRAKGRGRTHVTLADLQRRALELVKQADFGDEASRVNAAITELAPRDISAWTRLGRCHLEQRNWDDAVIALRAALELNPSHTIATNLLNEVRKQRARTPTAAERSTTGFGAREFAMIASLSGEDACAALRPRIDALLDTLNATDTAALIVSARRSRGEDGSKLFHADSHSAPSTGLVSVFHHGGRYEPQFNIGWLSQSSVSRKLREDRPRLQPLARGWRRRAGTRPRVLRAVSAHAGEVLEARARPMDGGERRVHSIRRSSARGRCPAGPGRGVAPALPERRGARMDLRRTLAVSRERGRRENPRATEPGSRRSSTIPSATLYPIWLGAYRPPEA